jgi:hypothetical protein
MGGIRIHPRGHVTDYRVVRRLEQTSPRSHRKAQDVLVAAKHYVKGPGIFRSRGSLIVKLQGEIYALLDTLREEGYKSELKEDDPTQLVFSYLSEFSDAYPNWQGEYTALSKFIPQCF